MKKTTTLLFAILLWCHQLSAQCVPSLLDTAITDIKFCDYSTNDTNYWSLRINPLIWNQEFVDWNEGETELKISFLDTCANNNYTVHFYLLLDLDNDDIRESSVASNNNYLPGTIFYSGTGTTQLFDKRPVPVDQKWKFSLETVHDVDTTTVFLRWNTQAAPDVFVKPELPAGKHFIRWEILDGTTVVKTLKDYFTIKDCLAPSVQCRDSLVVQILPDQMVRIYYYEVLQSQSDNYNGALFNSMRKAGTGTGFPLTGGSNFIKSLTFNCDELGPQGVELWSRDESSNISYCETTIHITDDPHYCSGTLTELKTCITAGCAQPTEEFFMQIDYQVDSTLYNQLQYGNCQSINVALPDSTEVTLTPVGEDDPVTGLGTYDLLILNQQILGTDPLDNPYQWFAADANLDGVINNEDYQVCRDAVLGVAPLAKPWRFVEENHQFPPGNPLAAPLQEFVTFNTANITQNLFNFTAVRVCDLSCGNLVGFFELKPETRHLIGTPQPNPAVINTQIPLQLIDYETVNLEISNLSGQLLFQQTLSLPPGNALLDIPLYAMPNPGLYVWKVQAGGVLKAGKLCRS
jgi:hypothetical protein